MSKPLDLPLQRTAPAPAAAKPEPAAQSADDPRLDYLPESTSRTLPELFAARVARSPDRVAYQQFDSASQTWVAWSWRDVDCEVKRWCDRLAAEGLQPGERVAIRRRNGVRWVLFDQAALALGLVVVPLYVDDRPENVAYIVADAGVKLLYLESDEQWQCMAGCEDQLGGVTRVVVENPADAGASARADPRIQSLDQWLAAPVQGPAETHAANPGELATIVYTSGTTGRPKGVMLSHRNIVENARAGLAAVKVFPDDVMLSFLPLSHTLERTVGYYLAIMAGCGIVFARSVAELAEDLLTHRPTVLVSVPRIYERVYGKLQAKLQEGSPIKRKLFEQAVAVGWRRFEHQQGRAGWSPALLLWPLLDKLVASKVRERLGGRMRLAVSGGAALPPSISRVFIGLGINILQGYGLTESSPMISANTLEHNRPDSIGRPLQGIEVKLGERDELLARGPNIMLGYWNNPAATAAVIDAEGWLHTGDRVRIDEEGFLYITGRLKEIIVLANGEKVPPADMEAAIQEDALFEQVLLVGEQRPYLSALVVLNEDHWKRVACERGLSVDARDDPAVEQVLLERIAKRLTRFPGYAQIRRVRAVAEPWTVFTGLATPTMKLKREQIIRHHEREVREMYAGH